MRQLECAVMNIVEKHTNISAESKSSRALEVSPLMVEATSRFQDALNTYRLAQQHETKNKVRSVISQVLDLKRSEDLTDEDFSEILSLVLSQYIEQEIYSKVSRKLDDRLMKMSMIFSRELLK